MAKDRLTIQAVELAEWGDTSCSPLPPPSMGHLIPLSLTPPPPRPLSSDPHQHISQPLQLPLHWPPVPSPIQSPTASLLLGELGSYSTNLLCPLQRILQPSPYLQCRAQTPKQTFVIWTQFALLNLTTELPFMHL